MLKSGSSLSASFSSPAPSLSSVEELLISEFRNSDFLISILELIEEAQGNLGKERQQNCSDNNSTGSGEGIFVVGDGDRSGLLGKKRVPALEFDSKKPRAIRNSAEPRESPNAPFEFPFKKPSALRNSGGTSEFPNSPYIDGIKFHFSSEIDKSADLDFEGTSKGNFLLSTVHENDNESNASYTDKEGDRLRFSIEDESLIMYVNGDKCAGCDDITGVVKKLTFTPGQPADVRTQHGWGSSDMPWPVVRKLKAIADRVGVANNLPSILPSVAPCAFRESSSQAMSGTSLIRDDPTKIEQLERSPTKRASMASALASVLGSAEEQQQRTTRKVSHVFTDIDDLKANVRKALIRGKVGGHDLLREQGICQKIVRSLWFEYVTFIVVPLNSLWVALDTDVNTSESNNSSLAITFVVVDALFAVFFLGEWVIRFRAFRDKWEGLQEKWFMLDTVITAFLILDVVVAIFTRAVDFLNNTSLLKTLRALRLVRMARITRMMRSMPELVILLKGISVAAKSVFFTLFLLTIFVFVSSVAFRQLTDGTGIGDKYFKNVPAGMYSLILYATLPDMAEIVNNVSAEHVLLGAAMLLFIMGASLLVMNMLVGLLVEVVSVVSTMEKEERKVWAVKTKLAKLLKRQGWRNIESDENLRITREDFMELVALPDAAQAMADVGVDPVALIENVEIVFDDSPMRCISFPELIELLLQLRGSNMCTVKDIIDLRKFVLHEFIRVEKMLDYHTDLMKRARTEAQKDNFPIKYRDESAGFGSGNSGNSNRDSMPVMEKGRTTRVFGNIIAMDQRRKSRKSARVK